jgi:protein SCO1/2
MLRRLMALLLLVVILASGAIFVTWQADRSRSELPVLGELTPFEFVANNGEPFGLADLRGKLNVVDFIFTRCMGPCPIMSATMAQLYRQYESSDEVRFVSISVDPEYDSVAVLQQYALTQGVTDERWIFLRGPIEEVKRMSEEDFMLDAATLPAGHTTKFILVDEQARIRGYYDSFDDASLNVLKSNIRELAKKLP